MEISLMVIGNDDDIYIKRKLTLNWINMNAIIGKKKHNLIGFILNFKFVGGLSIQTNKLQNY